MSPLLGIVRIDFKLASWYSKGHLIGTTTLPYINVLYVIDLIMKPIILYELHFHAWLICEVSGKFKACVYVDVIIRVVYLQGKVIKELITKL